MKIIQVRNDEITFGEGDAYSATISSHECTLPEYEGCQVVRVITNEFEVSHVARTRGEALVGIAEYLRALDKKLRQTALVQEGVTGLTVGDLT